MKGLRKPEGNKFERFFSIVQNEAKRRGAVFFADSGEGKEFSNELMEGENLSGWLIPFEKADDFERIFKKDGNTDNWDDYYCFAIWENEKNPTIKFKWY